MTVKPLQAMANAAFETDVFSEPLPGQLYVTPPPPGENFAFLKSYSSEKQRRLYTCTVGGDSAWPVAQLCVSRACM